MGLGPGPSPGSSTIENCGLTLGGGFGGEVKDPEQGAGG